VRYFHKYLLFLPIPYIRRGYTKSSTDHFSRMSEGKFPGAIGIDLGTTYSCVAVYDKTAGVEIIANEQGNRTTPSYVAFTPEERLVGDSAKNQAALNPENTVFDAKRMIGRSFTDESIQTQRSRLSTWVRRRASPHRKSHLWC